MKNTLKIMRAVVIVLFSFVGGVVAYLVYPGFLLGGPWQVGWGVRAAEYGPCALLALTQWWPRRARLR